MKKSISLALLSFLSLISVLQAKTVVISDIDDTLKMSHVTSIRGMAGRAFLTGITFKGMPELLREIAKVKDVEGFYYLSAAPAFLMKKSHQKFLTENNYPMGTMILRDDEPKATHKLVNIRKILNKENPDQVIMLGDNGEQDSDIYKTISEEFPRVQFHTFIHYVYPNAINGGQHAFATSLEVLLTLIDESILKLPSLVLANKMALEIASEENTGRFDVQYFPHFMDCSGYDWNLPTADIRILNYKKALEKVETRCQ